jgi:CheY-like chemotaxis protein
MVRKSILIVDDDLGILKSFKDLLEPEGYSVDTAETALEAVEKSKRDSSTGEKDHDHRIPVSGERG